MKARIEHKAVNTIILVVFSQCTDKFCNMDENTENICKLFQSPSTVSCDSLTMLGIPPEVVVNTVVVGGVTLPSFSQVMLGRGTPLALQDSDTLLHSRTGTTGEG